MQSPRLTLYGAYHLAKRVLPLSSLACAGAGGRMCAYCRFCIRMNERTIVFSSSDSQADNALVMVVELLSFHTPHSMSWRLRRGGESGVFLPAATIIATSFLTVNIA